MGTFASREDVAAMQAEATWPERAVAHSIYDYLSKTRAAHGTRPAASFQLLSGPGDKSLTYSWNQLHAHVTQAANMFRALGIGENDVVAYVLPNAMETIVTLLAGAVAWAAMVAIRGLLRSRGRPTASAARVRPTLPPAVHHNAAAQTTSHDDDPQF